MNIRLTTLAAMISLLVPISVKAQQKPAIKLDDPGDFEVRRPEGFDDQEWRVLHSIETLSTERLVQLLLVYERLNNAGMLDVLVRSILKRDPKNKEAQRVRDGGQAEETVRPAGYLEELSRKVMAGERVADPDSVPVLAMSLILEGRAPEAVTLLEKLRANQFKGASYPYLDDLAYSLGEAGRLKDAETAYRAVIADKNMSVESVAEAQQALPHILIKIRIQKVRQDAGRDGEALLAGSAKLLTELPDDADVQAFRVESLQLTRRYADAVAFLLEKKKKHTGDGPWPWQPELGFCYFGAREFDKAISIFREIHKDARYDDRSRAEASTMILEIQVTREIEKGMYAMQRGDLETGKLVLHKLETDYKSHRDVLGYRSLYLAKTGRSDEALRELDAKKTDETAQGLAFSQQDALADVLLERKEFDKAREATLIVIQDPRYDEEMRGQAMKRMEDITVAEAQHNAFLALRDGHRARARAIVADLRRTLPRRIEVRMLEAEIALAYFQAKIARDELLAIKAAPYPQGFAGMPFDAQNSLASAHAMAGEWETAYQAYAEVVNAPEFNYEAEDIWEARWEMRELRPWFRPTFTLTTTLTKEDEGDLFITSHEYKTAWHNDWRFGVFARSITTDLKRGGSIFASRGRDTQYEGGVTAMRRFGDNYFLEAMVGASEEDAIYGLRVGKLAYRTLGWSLGFMGNALSTDSVNLQALNGRENRLEFKLAGPLTDRVLVDFNAWYQWNRVGGSRLGTGYGASGEIDYVLQTETRKRPEISIGYAFDYSRFDAAATLPPRITNEVRRAEAATTEVRPALGAGDEVRRAVAGNFGNEVFDSLVDPYTNRHGIVLKARKHFENHLALSGSIGAYYAFDDAAVGFTGSIAAEYWINEASMIYAELRYDSSGKGASSNGGVWEANIGGQMSF